MSIQQILKESDAPDPSGIYENTQYQLGDLLYKNEERCPKVEILEAKTGFPAKSVVIKAYECGYANSGKLLYEALNQVKGGN